MSLLFIYSLINYYTTRSSVTLAPSVGGARSRGAAGQGVGVRRDTGMLLPHVRLCGQRRPAIRSLRSRQQLPAPGSSRQAQFETLTGHSTAASARLIPSPKASFAAQYLLLAVPSACQNATQTAQGSLATRPA